MSRWSSKTSHHRVNDCWGSIAAYRLRERTTNYGGVAPDKITIYRGPLERLYGSDAAELRRQVRRTVRHEIAHHFGISDQRLVDIDRY